MKTYIILVLIFLIGCEQPNLLAHYKKYPVSFNFYHNDENKSITLNTLGDYLHDKGYNGKIKYPTEKFIKNIIVIENDIEEKRNNEKTPCDRKMYDRQVSNYCQTLKDINYLSNTFIDENYIVINSPYGNQFGYGGFHTSSDMASQLRGTYRGFRISILAPNGDIKFQSNQAIEVHKLRDLLDLKNLFIDMYKNVKKR